MVGILLEPAVENIILRDRIGSNDAVNFERIVKSEHGSGTAKDGLEVLIVVLRRVELESLVFDDSFHDGREVVVVD